MHIIDIIHEFTAVIKFEGDNETDINEITIERPIGVSQGIDKFAVETYQFSRVELSALADGLNQLAEKIKDYLNS